MCILCLLTHSSPLPSSSWLSSSFPPCSRDDDSSNFLFFLTSFVFDAPAFFPAFFPPFLPAFFVTFFPSFFPAPFPGFFGLRSARIQINQIERICFQKTKEKSIICAFQIQRNTSESGISSNTSRAQFFTYTNEELKSDWPSRGLMNSGNSISSSAFNTSSPLIVCLFFSLHMSFALHPNHAFNPINYNYCE